MGSMNCPRRAESSRAGGEGLPTAEDICPVVGDLDAEVAKKDFLGKSIDSAVALFHENSLCYKEDLMFMGPKAFCFYLPAVLLYLLEQEDEELAEALASLFEIRLDHDGKEIQPSFWIIRAICQHLMNQDSTYVEEITKSRLAALLLRVAGC